MSQPIAKLRTLLAILRVLAANPYALRRVLVDDEGIDRSVHDYLYRDDYFQFMEDNQGPSCEVIAKSIVDEWHPRLAVDVGCGTGLLLQKLANHRVGVMGLEFASVGLEFCRAKELDVQQFDAANDEVPTAMLGADLAISMEVGQQIPELGADRYITSLCDIAPVVLFSSATPGESNRIPLNEKPHRYWIEKFSVRGYEYNERLSQRLRRDWRGREVVPWLYRNVMVFESTQSDRPGPASANG